MPSASVSKPSPIAFAGFQAQLAQCPTSTFRCLQRLALPITIGAVPAIPGIKIHDLPRHPLWLEVLLHGGQFMSAGWTAKQIHPRRPHHQPSIFSEHSLPP